MTPTSDFSFLPLQPLAASRWWLRWSAFCHPRGRPGLCSRLLPSVQPSSRLLRTPGEETALQVPAPSTHVSDVNVPSRRPAERGAVLPQCPAHSRICQHVVTAVHTGLALTTASPGQTPKQAVLTPPPHHAIAGALLTEKEKHLCCQGWSARGVWRPRTSQQHLPGLDPFVGPSDAASNPTACACSLPDLKPQL